MTTREDRGIFRLRLYIAGDSPNSGVALAILRALVAERVEVRIELEVIDVMQTPELGVRDSVTVIPMLVKAEPLPVRRVLGNLRDRARLFEGLGLDVPSLG